MSNDTEILVIGIGNEFRGDDAIGLLTARLLKEKLSSQITILEESGEGTRLMEVWKGFEKIIIIDAVRSGDQPGKIHQLDASEQKIPSDLFYYSTHAFGVAEAIETARALKRLPSEIHIYGIEGSNFAMGSEISEIVKENIAKLQQIIIENEFQSISN